MIKMKKYAIAIITVLLLTFSNCPDIQAKYLVDHAKAGKNATWSLDTEGNMTVEGKGAVNIGGKKFARYWTGVKKIVINKGITNIQMVSGFGKAKCIQLPSTISDIGISALSDNESLKKLVIPQKVSAIHERAIQSCKSLQTIQLPSKLKTIGADAFKNCKSLQTLKIPDSVTQIGKGAFDNCSSLETLVLPKRLKKMDADFSKTKSLRKVVNRSKKTILLDSCDGKRVWTVNGKKVTKLAPGKTAVTKGVRYRLTYSVRGGKVSGKLPKYYYYGTTPKLPEVTKEGYDFLGWYWLQCDKSGIPEKFPAKSGKNIELTAMLVKVDVTRLSETTVEFTVKDSVSWREEDMNPPDEVLYVPQYCIRVYTERPTEPYKGRDKDYKAAQYLEVNRGKMVRCEDLAADKTYYYEISFRWFLREGDDFESYGRFCGWHQEREVPGV